MFHDYYIIYQVDFDKYNIEINYMSYDMGMNIVKTICFNDIDEQNMSKLQDLLHSLDFDDRSNENEEI
jgi:hypothetical protein